MKILKCYLLVFFISLGLFSTTAQAKFAEAPDYILNDFIDDNYLILGFKIQGIDTDVIVESYTTNQGYYISLEQFVEAVLFKISFDYNTHNAAGWFIEEGMDFKMDFAKRSIVTNGNKLQLKEEDMVIYMNEVYINSKILDKLFEIAVIIDSAKLLIEIKSKHILFMHLHH